MLLIILLATPYQRATAGSEVIPISGVCVIFNEWQGDDFRGWQKDDWSMMHWRNNTFIFDCDYNDDRLDGYILIKDGWNIFANTNKENMSQTLSTGYSSDEFGNQTDFWEYNAHGMWTWDWQFHSYISVKGRGPYQNLHANLVMTVADPVTYPVTGELHDAGYDD
jgi:hypothetical protein